MGDAVLAELEGALQRLDRRATLAALLEIWRRWPHASVEDAIGAQSRPLLWRYLVDDRQQWHVVADKRDGAAVPALLAAPWRRDSPSALRKKLQALARFPPDPRVAAFAEDALGHLTQSRPGVEQTRAAALALRERHRPDEAGLPWPGARLEALLDRARALKELDELLMDKICADLDDDGVRLVYADYLQSQGDALGDYIATSLKPGRREQLRWDDVPQEMRAPWVRALMGGQIAPEVVRFWRGLPYALVVQTWVLPELERWPTIELVHVDYFSQRVLKWLPSLSRLPHLRLISFQCYSDADRVEAALGKLSAVRAPELRLERFVWDPRHGERVDWPLTRLWLDTRETWGVDEASLGSLARSLPEVVLSGRDPVDGAVKASDAAGPALRAIHASADTLGTLESSELAASLLRTEDGRFGHLRLQVTWRTVLGLAQFLRPLSPERFSHVTVETPDHADRAFQVRARRALWRFRALPIAFMPRGRVGYREAPG